MGRYGGKATAEETKSLDINWLKRKGFLVPGRSCSLNWHCNGELVGEIGMRAECTSIVLDYRWREWGTEWEDVTERVLLTSTPCTFGGQRCWFVCPHCSRRARKLFGAGKYFLCRHCYRLAYESQREDRYGRLVRKIQNIRTRLGGSSYLADPFPPKPKGMHETTYKRLQQKAEEAEWEADTHFIARVDRLLGNTVRISRGLK